MYKMKKDKYWEEKIEKLGVKNCKTLLSGVKICMLISIRVEDK